MILSGIKKIFGSDFENKSLLEIGCGSGGVLHDFEKWGTFESNILGIDLLFDRLMEAKQRLPNALIAESNGEYIPFQSNRFDIVLQFTALSSILDANIRQNVANEMLRVLKPDGLIIWYDFWLNPMNRQTHGITKKEIKHLFGNGCRYAFHKITLAPPIARKLVPISRIAAEILESIRIFNTHWLVFIRKE